MWWIRKLTQQNKSKPAAPTIDDNWREKLASSPFHVVRHDDTSVVYQQMPPNDRMADCPRCGSRAGLSSSGSEGEFTLAHFLCRVCGLTISYRYKSTDDYESFYWR